VDPHCHGIDVPGSGAATTGHRWAGPPAWNLQARRCVLTDAADAYGAIDHYPSAKLGLADRDPEAAPGAHLMWVVAALANKLARTIWAVLAHGRPYEPILYGEPA
jgi:hypothetical protein